MTGWKLQMKATDKGGLMEGSFSEENARERERLRSLAGRLTDEELALPMGSDWTIAVALAHLAFWDQRSLVLLRKWKASGVVAPSPIDIDVTNDSLLCLWESLEPRKAADLAVACAESIDRELQTASPEIIAQIEALGEEFRLYRSIHRKLHLDQIETLLKERD
jgi:hypothetical protein